MFYFANVEGGDFENCPFLIYSAFAILFLIILKWNIMICGYKDIINFSIIKKLKGAINDVCILFNNIVSKERIANRESEYYEVYTEQYKKDLKNLQEIRDNCLKVADVCNKIMLEMNTYHIKQYYLDPEELTEYEFLDEYKSQLPKKEEKIIEQVSTEAPQEIDDDDIW